MLLRERLWRRSIGLTRGTKLPKMQASFGNSGTWTIQADQVDTDLNRMPAMNRENVMKLVKRHVATCPWYGYTQGHLYIIYAIGLVLHDECSMYWAYTRIIRSQYRFGPSTPVGVHVVPDWVYNEVADRIEIGRDMWDVLIRFRWLFIMFGQTCSTPEILCAIWDFNLQHPNNMFYTCAALLRHGLEQEVPQVPEKCALERASDLISIQIQTTAEAASILARANIISNEVEVSRHPDSVPHGRRRVRYRRSLGGNAG